jgi:tetratricopeptide (TPR) repeat protein
LSTKAGRDESSTTLTNISKFYQYGKLEQALLSASTTEKKKPGLLKNPKFALLYTKILLETDGPSSKIRSVLTQALLENPGDPALMEYMEVVEARSHLSREKNDVGEVQLTNLIRRSPKNVHALFLLGSHLFWVEGETQRPLRYLEQAYRLRPQFLRSTACLAALYRKLEQPVQSKRLFRECVALESSSEMKAYFKSLS